MTSKTPHINILRAIFLIFLALLAVLSTYHEYWRDELQAFLLVKASDNLLELFANSAYEGHPSLWFLLLFFLKSFAPTLMAMKVLHLLISAGVGWLVIRYSGFKLRDRVLLLFGYYLFYEYGFIVRNYALGILFIFGFCTLYKQRTSGRHFLYMSLMILGMMVSNFYSFFIGFSFVLMIFCEHLFYRAADFSFKRYLPGYLIMVAGICIFLADTIPPEDYGYASIWITHYEFGEVKKLLERFSEVFMPMQQLSVNFWNNSIFGEAAWKPIAGAVISLLVIAVVARNALARVFFISIFILMMTFSYMKFSGYLRHNGHLFVAVVALVWIQPHMPRSENLRRVPLIIFEVLLLLQFLATPIAVFYEWKYPFSQSENAGNYLQANFPDALIVAHEDAATSPVSAYLGKTMYYPGSGRFGTFIIWDRTRLETWPSLQSMLEKGDALAKEQNKEVLYLFTFEPKNADSLLTEIQTFTPAIEPVEAYRIYKRKSLGAE